MTTTVPVATIDLRRISPMQARFIGELLAQVWPRPGVGPAERAVKLIELGQGYAADNLPSPRSFVVFELGRVIAHSCILPRTIRVGDEDLLVAGLSRVCTDPMFRGRGLGEVVVRAAFAPVDRGEFPAAYFQTTRTVRAFYEKLGCALTTNRVVNSLAEDREANPFWDEVTMRYPASGSWGEGVIDLRGPGY